MLRNPKDESFYITYGRYVSCGLRLNYHWLGLKYDPSAKHVNPAWWGRDTGQILCPFYICSAGWQVAYHPEVNSVCYTLDGDKISPGNPALVTGVAL